MGSMIPHSLNNLIERVEAASGPDRELDLAIMVALDLRPDWLRKSTGELWVDASGRNPVVRWADQSVGRSVGNPNVDDGPKFTASLDAAMTLVPDDCTWLRLSPATMTVSRPDPNEKRWAKHFDARAATPALALCAAALKARARTPDEKDQTNG